MVTTFWRKTERIKTFRATWRLLTTQRFDNGWRPVNQWVLLSIWWSYIFDSNIVHWIDKMFLASNVKCTNFTIEPEIFWNSRPCKSFLNYTILSFANTYRFRPVNLVTLGVSGREPIVPVSTDKGLCWNLLCCFTRGGICYKYPRL